jgi:hypothetical protein
MAIQVATLPGKIICFRCRRALTGDCPRCQAAAPGSTALADLSIGRSHLGLWIAGAMVLGSMIGAALSLVH